MEWAIKQARFLLNKITVFWLDSRLVAPKSCYIKQLNARLLPNYFCQTVQVFATTKRTETQRERHGKKYLIVAGRDWCVGGCVQQL